MDYKDFEELEDIMIAVKTVVYPEFDFLVEMYKKDVFMVSARIDSLDAFISWMSEKKELYKKLTKE